MTTITHVTTTDLDPGWVDAILIAGFDAHYGGSWYWVRDDDSDVDRVTYTYGGPDPILPGERLLAAVNLVRVDGPHNCEWVTDSIDAISLGRAWNSVVNPGNTLRDDLVAQLERAMETPDELPDIDADAADCLIQIAAFGEVVFG